MREEDKITEEEIQDAKKKALFLQNYLSELRFFHEKDIENWIKNVYYPFTTTKFCEPKSLAISFLTDERGIFYLISQLKAEIPSAIIRLVERTYNGYINYIEYAQKNQIYERYYATGLYKVHIVVSWNGETFHETLNVDLLTVLTEDFLE